jgi:UDP-N-acetylmuramate: L-alanyl-gamma-D-glutamyl-meso-diaminopimelate ligase
MLYFVLFRGNCKVTGKPLDIYCIAIGGTGMAPLACLLQERGHSVRGSDRELYPPMSTLLADAGITPLLGFDPDHLVPDPDLVIVGNAVPRNNPEAEEVERRGLSRISMPQALYLFFLQERRPLAVAGTHGKTTTSAMAASLLTRCGAAPGYLIGGVPLDLPGSFSLGSGPRFVVEADEYNAAYFDRGPKFLHYRPDLLILTSVEFDHADLYPSSESLVAAFCKLVQGLPQAGALVACGDHGSVLSVAREAPCRIWTYGLSQGCSVWARNVVHGPGRNVSCSVQMKDAGVEVDLNLAVPGEHNLSNALAVWTAAVLDGHDPREAAEALAEFKGVRRRLEVLGSPGGVTVIDDFAHHPTAVKCSLGALRRAYPDRRLVAIYEPRSLTAGRAFFHDAYLEALSLAHRALIAPVFHRGRLPEEELLDVEALAGELQKQGVDATACESLDQVRHLALSEAREGDVLVSMSSGAFDGLPHGLLEALGGR